MTKKVTKENCLANKHPKLIKEWHPTKNENLTPYNITYGSHKKVWWICKKCQYEWDSIIKNRSMGRGCPACSGRVVTENNCLANNYPKLTKEWHPTKNGNLTPYDVTCGNGKIVWWKCNKCQYEWQTTIANRSGGNNCPACSGRAVTENNCLANNYPEITAEWHPTKNGNLTPYDVTYGSHKKVWWICKKCQYEWDAIIFTRSNGANCPACAGKAVTENNCLANNYPKIAVEWHPTKNGNLTPYDVTCGSKKKIWWKCNKCQYEWQRPIHYVTKNNNLCPYCTNQVVTYNNCLATNDPELIKSWHPIKNNDLTPYNVTYGSNKIVWWLCQKCQYEWKAKIVDRFCNMTYNCPACSGRVVTENNCLANNYPKLTKEWHPTKNGNLTPYDVTKGDRKNVWWLCQKCQYEWGAYIYSRTYSNCNCPACSGQIATEKTCLANNYPEIAAEWHPIKNGNLTPKNTTQRSGKKIWWICKKCEYEWDATVGSRTGLQQNGCPKCARTTISNSGSQWLDELKIPNENREITIKIAKRIFRVDGYDPNTKTVYEYFGNFWHGNPRIYNSNDINPRSKKTYGELYQKTMERIKILEENGYKVIYKWGD